jgi:threonine-phosphate decarboxylase
VPVRNVVATNGAVAALHLLAQVRPGARSAIAIPAFSEYEEAAVRQRHQLVFFPADDLARGHVPDADVVWFANPNNPTGDVLAPEKLLAIVDARPSTLFIVDLAYSELCAERPLRVAEAVRRQNLVAVMSFTKRHAIPGLRLGAVVGPEEIVEEVAARGGPWAVNSLALAAGRHLLSCPDNDGDRRLGCLAESLRMQAVLGALPGGEVRPSATNYFLLRTSRGTGAELREHLLRENALLVRDAANFRGLDPHWIRIAAQTSRENVWLEEAVRRWATRA